MSTPTEPGRSRGPRWLASRRRRVLAGGLVLVVAAGAALAATDPFSSQSPGGSGTSDNSYPTSTATVQRETLTQQTQVNATLGYSGSDDLSIPAGSAAATLSTDRAAVAADQQKVATDETALQNAQAVAKPNGASTLLAAETEVKADQKALNGAKRLMASDRRLGCPASSSSTVGSSTAGSSPGSSSTTTTTTTPSSAGSPGASSTPSGTTGSGRSHVRAEDSAPGAGLQAHLLDAQAGTGTSGSGSDVTTTTAAPTAPDVTTGAADGTTSSSTTLTGSVNADGAGTSYWFEYGTSANYGSTTSSTSVGSGTTPASISAGLSGLSSGQTYHYRLVASNSVGTTYGADATFTTSAAPVAVTGSGAELTTTSETLSGTVNPGGVDTTYYFEFGRTPALGRRTVIQDAGAGSQAAAVSATASALAPNANYDFRLVAVSSLGTSVGALQTFTTAESSCVAQIAVMNQDAESLRTAKDALASDRLGLGSSVASDQQALQGDEQSLSAAEEALSLDQSQEANPGATFTELPKVGAVIHRGQAAYSLGGHPVALLYGAVPPYRALYLGVAPGPDVAELNDNLAALGFGSGLAGSDQFGAATETAVKAWQGSLGEGQTGVVALGEFVVTPGAIQVDSVTPTLGADATAGTAVLTATSTTPQVTIALDASLQSDVKVGDPVTITLPDSDTTPGVVSSVGSVAVSASTSSGNTGSSATVTVEVTPSDPSATKGLDQASVEVAITTGTARDALVVPVDALLALSGGGYALEEVGPSRHHFLVPVTLGLFDDEAGTVAVTGSGVAPGQTVVIPST